MIKMKDQKNNTIWESSQQEAMIEHFIEEMVASIKNKADSKRETFIKEKLQDILQEKRLLRD